MPSVTSKNLEQEVAEEAEKSGRVFLCFFCFVLFNSPARSGSLLAGSDRLMPLVTSKNLEQEVAEEAEKSGHVFPLLPLFSPVQLHRRSLVRSGQDPIG